MMFLKNTTNRVESFLGISKHNKIKIEGLYYLVNLVKYIRQLKNTKRKEIKSNFIKNSKLEVGIDLIAGWKILTNFYFKHLKITIRAGF